MEEYRDLDEAEVGAYTPEDRGPSLLQWLAALMASSAAVGILAAVCAVIMVAGAIMLGFGR